MCDAENCFCPPCECHECKLEREAGGMWVDFLALAAVDPDELEEAIDAALDIKPLGMA